MLQMDDLKPDMTTQRPATGGFRGRLHKIVFEADTFAGKAFDVTLLALILSSITVVILESIASFRADYSQLFFQLEWIFTIIFTIEYVLRLYATKNPWKYATSFFGILDLLAILPTYLSLLGVGSRQLLVVRALRLIRVFRIFKLGHFLNEGATIINALRASRAKITVFLAFVLLLVLIMGSLMYVVEGANNKGFSDIPSSVYWAVVTLTTVGYGDIIPKTPIGQFFSVVIMLMGYAIIAVPTGIVSAEMAHHRNKPTTQTCPNCSRQGHDEDAEFCKYCGSNLHG